MADTRLVGIINVTPDSFSDGGKYMTKDAAVAAIKRMIADGAGVIDIGAESTRPGALSVSPDEEWRRLEPVLQALPGVRAGGVQFSIDTRNPQTAKKALELARERGQDELAEGIESRLRLYEAGRPYRAER